MPTSQFSTEDIPILKGTEEKRIKRVTKLCSRLELMYRELAVIQSVIMVCVGALDHQNAEQDDEIGTVLTRCADDRIHQQLKRLAKLIRKLGGSDDYGVEVTQ